MQNAKSEILNANQIKLPRRVKQNRRKQMATQISTSEFQEKVLNSNVPVLVDFFATWCGPCLKEFQYLPALKEKAHNMDVVYLYISIDRPEERKKWEKTIAYHQLKGYHLLVNEKLGKSLYTELGKERQILSIPCFVIIDKTGKIVIRHAAAPSEPEKVIEQLSTYYNK